MMSGLVKVRRIVTERYIAIVRVWDGEGGTDGENGEVKVRGVVKVREIVRVKKWCKENSVVNWVMKVRKIS